ncbi:unnamed protein product [Peronospora belbahrii]|uniref:Uncharacterized protein n=1 Tax=Peronospora belbahrii TaxID=622444 RepID=A0AAU9KYJ6_9STRA|nr:unnamed protein product [Peronospora belbahrii]CAH0513762.1 unnamed protein product [Peronospora belbahrii]
MTGSAGSEKIVYTTGAGAFFGVTAGAIESVWAIPKLGVKLPKLSAQLKHLGTRSFVFAAVGCMFSTGEYLSASIRQKEDPINAGALACALRHSGNRLTTRLLRNTPLHTMPTAPKFVTVKASKFLIEILRSDAVIAYRVT